MSAARPAIRRMVVARLDACPPAAVRDRGGLNLRNEYEYYYPVHILHVITIVASSRRALSFYSCFYTP